MSRLLQALLLVLVASPAWATVTINKSSTQTQAYVGGTVSYDVSVVRTDTLFEKGLVLHDPLPAGHTLLSVTAGGNTVDCTTVASGSLGNGILAVCDSGGELQISIPDNITNPPAFNLQYRVTGSASSNTASATCSSASQCPRQSTASVPVVVAPLTITKAVDKPTAAPGESLSYTVTVQNGGAATASGYGVHDVLPAGLTFKSLRIANMTFTAATLPQAQAQAGTSATLTGNTLDLLPPPLPAGQTFTAVITCDIDAAATNGTVYSNVASVTPQGGSAVNSAAATTTVNVAMMFPDFTKRVTPDHAKAGDPVTYTITVAPKTPINNAFTLTDPIDPALQLTQIKVMGAVTPCGATPVMAGAFMVDCGADGRSFRLTGTALTTPLTVEIGAQIQPTAGREINNTATLDVTTASRTSAATLTIDNAPQSGASLTLAAGRVLASKGDLVPFTAVIGVPFGAPTLPSPVLALNLSRGLRPGDVRVGGVPQKPTESNGQVLLALPPIAPGSTLTVEIRARVTFLSGFGVETARATLQQDAMALAAASATVRVIAEPEFDLGTLVGEVFRDDNGNGVRDRGERPIEGALIVMDDGLQVLTDREGRYHLAAILPGERAIKLARHTLPPDSRFTTDETRVVSITPGILLKIDWGVQVPEPQPPKPRAPPTSMALPELRLTDAGGLVYQLVGASEPGAHVSVNGKPVRLDKNGAWVTDVILQRGRTRLTVVSELSDGRVVLAARDVYWIDRPEGGSLIVPRAEEPRLVLRFPGGGLAESTFQLEGTALQPISDLSIAGQKLVPDAKGHVAVRLRVPEAGAGVEVAARFTDGLQAKFSHELSGGGDYWLLVGLAEGKLGYVKKDPGPSGIKDSGVFAEGRVKLYAKGRIQGRWLLEGAVNIDSTQLSDWRDLFRGDPQKMFRNLDPDRFYTVYGDASQTVEGAPTRSRFYVRVALDRSELRFGNFSTGLTGVEFGRYSRAVTGGRLHFARAWKGDPNGPPDTQVIVFGAWLQTQRAHDELRGTGGSMYYLSHRNIVEGSEQVRVELRDRISDRPVANQAQRGTVDYEVDYLSGRLALRDPLSSIASSLTLVRASNLDGDKAYLVIDYEYIVAGDVDDASVGGRVSQRIGPVRVGGTLVNEFRSGGDYLLAGADLQVDLKKYGTIIGEYAYSSGSLTTFARSDDGGLSYNDALGAQQDPRHRQGHAWRGEADLHFFGISVHPYVRGMTQGFADTAHVTDAGFLQYGAEIEASFWKLKLRLHYDERRYNQEAFDAAGNDLMHAATETRRDIGGEIGGQFGRVGVRLGARSERSDDSDPQRSGHRTAIAARVDVRIVPKLTLYGHVQYAPEHDGPGILGQDNTLGAIGALATLPWDIGLQAEVSYGVFGAGGKLGLKTDLGKGRVLYGTVTLSQDRDDRVSTVVAAGGRERIDDRHGNARAFLFAEDQFRDGPLVLGDTSSRAHMLTAGLDLPLARRFLFSSTFERGEVTPSGTPLSGATPPVPISRTAGTASFSYGGERLRVQARGELRSDKVTDPATGKASDELSWLASGMVTAQPHKDLTLRGKALFSDSRVPGSLLARSQEASVGFAWRPSFTDRIALFGRYTWLDEAVPGPQGSTAPAFRERSHVMSLAGEARLFWRISLAEKVAAKRRQEPDLGTSDWMILWVNRASLHVTKTWDAVVEYRLMYGPGPALAHGVSVEVNRILVGHLRLGAGWNFADFSDDELRLGRGGENGFYVRAEGFY
jgi:uncharacterized repeat protein (TIGR01451 family)/fimbrial isopeptide formation D2 family protein